MTPHCTWGFKLQTETRDPSVDASVDVIPGEMLVADAAPIVINKNRRTATVTVTSLCDRPIQIGSHYHFLEANKYLKFDRLAAYGMRLV